MFVRRRREAAALTMSQIMSAERRLNTAIGLHPDRNALIEGALLCAVLAVVAVATVVGFADILSH